MASILDAVTPLGPESLDLVAAIDRVAADDLYARVDSPSVDASLRDGYAVCSHDVAGADAQNPVRLALAGYAAAGGAPTVRVTAGTTVRVLTGARIPSGADAVVAEEEALRSGDHIALSNPTRPGRYVLARGSDVGRDDVVLKCGEWLNPGRIGLLAAAGHSRVPVWKRPAVAILAVGDEIVQAGRPLTEGGLYASNLMMLSAWCRRHGVAVAGAIVRDDVQALKSAMEASLRQSDALITSGGAWTGDRDLVIQALEALGWQPVFQRVRMSPGKGTGFGMIAGKPVFVLPGGPPANFVGFLQIVMPGLRRLEGRRHCGAPAAAARLAQELTGRHADWTHFVFGRLAGEGDPPPWFQVCRGGSRLQAMAGATAVAVVPEGRTRLPAGSVVPVQVLA